MFHDNTSIFTDIKKHTGFPILATVIFRGRPRPVYCDVNGTNAHPFIDVHCHGLPASRDGIALQHVEFNALDRHDALPSPCSVGRHPWHAAAAWSDDDGRALTLLLERDECVALGEVGLDRVHGPTIERQRQLLELQLDIAAGRFPVIFHCVRAHADLMQLRKRRHAREPWILHGFSGHAELAGQLLRMGFHLSFGAAVLSSGGVVRESLEVVPPERLFLETDESGLDITLIYRAAAAARGCSEMELRKTISANYQSVFGTWA